MLKPTMLRVGVNASCNNCHMQYFFNQAMIRLVFTSICVLF